MVVLLKHYSITLEKNKRKLYMTKMKYLYVCVCECVCVHACVCMCLCVVECMFVDAHMGMLMFTHVYSCKDQRTMLGDSETLSLTIFTRLACQRGSINPSDSAPTLGYSYGYPGSAFMCCWRFKLRSPSLHNK